ncbi:hypothetical protein DPMN_064726 [Dreissena polymorpha]|uniref:SGNH hydrolase-type esterase domain-containing protein n=1 Tax=Dreissena polymorpha TaxID=45954 RepID=A0A9D4CCR4_DREPO|nr:hypothetical protein DPMN_064726 [Dreissena polymorpha]
MSVTYGVDKPVTLLNSSIEQDSRTVENASRVVNNDSRIVENEAVTDIEIERVTETDLQAKSDTSFDIDCATQTDSVENAIFKEMKIMNELLIDTKFRLNNFQQETTLQLSQLRDEIASVKNTISLANQQSTDKVKTISLSTEQLSKGMKQANDALHRKLQSVHNNIKKIIPSTANIAKRSLQNERSERATTKTPQSKKSNNYGSELERKEREHSQTEQILEVNTDIVDTADRADTTLIIGDSILNGINRRGLNKNTHIKTLPGRKIKDIRLTLDSCDTTKYKNVIIYIGGNDMAEGDDATKAYREIKQLLHELN